MVYVCVCAWESGEVGENMAVLNFSVKTFFLQLQYLL